jgi:hypothetical protein
LLSGNGNFYYYPTVQPDLEGNITVVYNFSGSGNYPSLGYVSQRVNQNTQSFVDSGLLLETGKGRYPQPAWGSYTAAAPAGIGYAAGGAVGVPGMWVAGAYAKANGSWGTQIGFTAYSAPNQP